MRTTMRITPLTNNRALRGAASLLLIIAVSCTEYTPVRLANAVPGYDVRVQLSDSGSVDLVPKIGPRARQLEGTLKQMTDTSLLVSVRRVTREGGGDDSYSDVEVLLPSRDIETVERNKTSVSRSILAAGAIVATAILAAKGAGDVSGGKNGGPPPPGK